MKKLLLLFLLLPLTSHADVTVSGSLASNATWSPENGVYIIDGHVTVPAGVTLMIAPGTVIKTLRSDTAARNIVIYGSLVARGDALHQIYLTSYQDDSVGGDTNGDSSATFPQTRDWQGIVFEEGSSGDLDFVTLRYGGTNGFVRFENQSVLTNDGGVVTIDHSIIEHNNNVGIEGDRGTLHISNSVVRDNGLGIYIFHGRADVSQTIIENSTEFGFRADGIDAIVALDGNTFANNRETAFINAEVIFTHENNTSTDRSRRAWRIGGQLAHDAAWHSRDLPTIPSLNVMAGITLTIESGTVLKFEKEEQLQIEGRLVAEGTEQSKIYFTSIEDDSVGGDANVDGGTSTPGQRMFGLFFFPGSTGSISHAVVRYGGVLANLSRAVAALYNKGGNISVTHTLFSNNPSSAILQDAGTISMSSSEITGSTFGLESSGGAYSLTGNSFHGNSVAIENHSSAVIDARNNWWGSNTGPHDYTATPTGEGDVVRGNVLYDPWLTTDPLASTTPTRIPVIIVPGIMGSKLNRDDDSNAEVWMNLFKMALPGDDSYLNELVLSITGEPGSAPGLRPTDIIRSVDVPLFRRHLFDGLIEALEESGYVEGKDIFVFAYDWRLDISKEAAKLKERIDQIMFQTGASKVNVVAHSMGGLVFKDFLKEFGPTSINGFIDIASPHFGAPKSFSTLTHGNTDIGILNQGTIKYISQNMPSIYELLPSQKYFDSTDNNYKYYVFNGVNNNSRLSFDQTKDYLKNAGRNSTLVDRADSFHQEIDNLNPADYGVKTYNIVGCGTPTIGQFYILSQKSDGSYEYNIKMISGDGTVPLRSAEAIHALKTYYAKGAVHATMPSTTGVKELVADLLTSDSDPNISSFSNITTNEADCPKINGKLVSFHSPIELHVYDANGNHVGPDANGDVESNIPGVDYEVIDGNKFAFLPDGEDYKIVGNATGDGTFDTRIETITDGEVSALTFFNDVPISTTAAVTFDVGSTTPEVMAIDNDGDSIFESSTTPSSVLTGSQALDLVKPVSAITLSGNKKGESYISSVKITLSATDDNSGVLKTEYSINSGSTWNLYVEPFTMNTRGGTDIMYRSTDKTGNVENPQTQIVNIIYPGSSGKK
ncbi:hypothetical protein KW785_01480 [Candidatus Parcubacteria bacterium]|nr:hypothetical protein [Candidatus Parcubacteria bacterium]